MFLFMILFLPLISIFLCLHSSDKSVIVVSGLGFIFGIVECFFIALFLYMHKVLENSFLNVFLHFFINENFLPILIAYLIYFFATKDSVEFRLKAFFPFAVAFYSVYFPYFLIASDGVVYSFFDLFLHPLMIFSMLFFVTISLVNVYNFAKNKSVSRIILHSFIALVVIVLPSVFESLIYMKIFTLLAYALVIAYVLLGIVYFFVSVRKSESALL